MSPEGSKRSLKMQIFLGGGGIPVGCTAPAARDLHGLYGIFRFILKPPPLENPGSAPDT